ncbi:MAG: MATE family efflux transporter [Clostridia bacterium]|nr:MATE family efflux transporter [Clostridia bacterium]
MTWITKDKSFYKNVFTLAIPISLQHLITFLVGFADNVMVGRLGDDAVSGVYLGGQLQFLLQQLVVGLGSALLILTAQYWGKGDTTPIRRLIGLVIRIGALSAILMSLATGLFPEQILSLFSDEAGAIREGVAYLRIQSLSYLFFAVSQILIYAMRSVETTRVGMMASLVTLVFNVVFNELLIFGRLGLPAMGVRGAAMATLIARIMECAAVAIYVFLIDQKLQMRLREIFAPAGKLVGHYLRYGLPVIAGDLVWAVNLMCQGAIVGHFTADVITAVSVTNTMNSLIYVWLNGLWGGVSIVIGKTIGAGKREKVKEYARTVQLMFLGVGVLSGALVFFGKELFLLMYQGISAEATTTARLLMTVLSCTIVGTCYQACCLGSLVKAGGDTSFVFKNDTIFVFLVVLPSAIIASRLGAPIWVVFLCLKIDQLLKCIVAVIKVNRFRWIRELANEKG